MANKTAFWKLDLPDIGVCEQNWPFLVNNNFAKIDALLWLMYGKNYFFVSHNGSGLKNGSSPDNALSLDMVLDASSNNIISSLTKFGDVSIILINDGQDYDLTSSSNVIHRLGQMTSSVSFVGYQGKPKLILSEPIEINHSNLYLQNVSVEINSSGKYGGILAKNSNVGFLNADLKGPVSWNESLIHLEGSKLGFGGTNTLTISSNNYESSNSGKRNAVSTGMAFITAISSQVFASAGMTFVREEELEPYELTSSTFEYIQDNVELDPKPGYYPDGNPYYPKPPNPVVALGELYEKKTVWGKIYFPDFRIWNNSFATFKGHGYDFTNASSMWVFDVYGGSLLDAPFDGSPITTHILASVNESFANLHNEVEINVNSDKVDQSCSLVYTHNARVNLWCPNAHMNSSPILCANQCSQVFIHASNFLGLANEIMRIITSSVVLVGNTYDGEGYINLLGRSVLGTVGLPDTITVRKLPSSIFLKEKEEG